MAYIVAAVTLMALTGAFHYGMSASIGASFFVALVWATFTGVFSFLWQRGWYGMLENKGSTVLANAIILSVVLIGVPLIDGISSEARLLVQFLVLGTGAAGQALGWLHSFRSEENSASHRKRPLGTAA